MRRRGAQDHVPQHFIATPRGFLFTVIASLFRHAKRLHEDKEHTII
jgi:hypothetical protein